MCDGYKSPSPRTQIDRVIRPRPQRQTIDLTEAESRALEFFSRVAVYELPCIPSSEHSWGQVALELSSKELSTTHGLIALASIYVTVNSGKTCKWDIFSLEQHNRSLALLCIYIHNLRDRSTDSDFLVILVACLSSAIYEHFCGRYPEAIYHLRTGMRIICERQYGRDEARRSEKSTIALESYLKTDYDILVQTFLQMDPDARWPLNELNKAVADVSSAHAM